MHTQRCAFFSLFRSPSVLCHPLSTTRAGEERTSLFLSLSFPIVTDSVLALRLPYQPFTGHDSGLMADRAIGFLQKRKRSSRKGAERAIGAAFVTLFVSPSLPPSPLSVFLFRAPASLYTLSCLPVHTPLPRVNEKPTGDESYIP